MSRFLNNINNQYLQAANRFGGRDRRQRIMVYVEGYDDIAFWRSVLEGYEDSSRRFEINTPARRDLAKGKKALLKMASQCGSNLILCMDSDFDYIFGDETPTGRLLASNRYMFQTYTYAIENYICYPNQLRAACVSATKNDSYIFDFNRFMADYSRAVYPQFLWYIASAYNQDKSIFPLADFRSWVRIEFLDLSDNGIATIKWLERRSQKKIATLEARYPHVAKGLDTIEKMLLEKGVTKDNIFLYMQGHTLLECVVEVVCRTVCEALKIMGINNIRSSSRRGVSLANELSSYKNSQRDVMEILSDMRLYTDSKLYKKLESDIKQYITNL